MDPGTRYLLVHGTATTSRIWDRVRAELPGSTVVVPDRPSTGRLDDELAALAPYAGPGTVYGGVSGGATLGLALLGSGVRMAGAVLHEPAVGSLVPGLLAPVAAAWSAHGVDGLGSTLYGPAWSPSDGPADALAVERDLSMFLGFEPGPIPPGSGPVIVTVGEYSPPVRHRAAAALREAFGIVVEVLPGCGHAAHLEQPAAYAAVLRACASAGGWQDQ